MSTRTARLTLNDMIYVSRRLEKAGVDMIHVSGGTTIKRGSAIPPRAPSRPAMPTSRARSRST